MPLTAVLLIDVSYSMTGAKLTRALDAAGQFATLLRSGDRLAIIAFNRQASVIHGFEESQPLASTALISTSPHCWHGVHKAMDQRRFTMRC